MASSATDTHPAAALERRGLACRPLGLRAPFPSRAQTLYLGHVLLFSCAAFSCVTLGGGRELFTEAGSQDVLEAAEAPGASANTARAGRAELGVQPRSQPAPRPAPARCQRSVRRLPWPPGDTRHRFLHTSSTFPVTGRPSTLRAGPGQRESGAFLPISF